MTNDHDAMLLIFQKMPTSEEGGGLKIQKNVDKGDGPYVTYIFMSIFMGQGTEVTQVLKDCIKIMKDNLSSSFSRLQ